MTARQHDTHKKALVKILGQRFLARIPGRAAGDKIMKRTIKLILIVLVVVSMLAVPFAGAASNVCFTAINDTLQTLGESTMPVIIGNILYIPCTFFASRELGVYYITSGSQLLLYNSQKRLLYDTALGIVSDQEDNRNYITANVQNGLIYVPVDEVCTYFGLSYDVIQSELAPVVRFYNTQQYLDQNTFLRLNMPLMQQLYDAYTQPETSPEAEAEVTFENVTVYLSFYELSSENFEQVLDLLEQYSCKACFFVSAEEIAADAALLRRAAGAGHTIGLWLTEGTGEEYEKSYCQLFEAAKIYSILVSAPDDVMDTARETAEAKGLVFWRPTKSYDSDTDSGYSLSSRLSDIESSRIGLNIPCTDEFVSQIGYLLGYLSDRQYTVNRITETTTPTYHLD